MKNAVRTGDIGTLVINQFHPENVSKKNELASSLKKLYLEQENFPALAREFEALDRVSASITENKSTMKQLGGKMEKTKTAPAPSLRKEAIVHSINVDELSDEDLRNILITKMADRIKEIDERLKGLEKRKAELEPLKVAFNKKFSEYCKERKAEFRNWKTANLPKNKESIAALKKSRKDEKKDTPRYCIITNQIKKLEDPTEHLLAAVEKSGLDEFTKDTYRIRINKDCISSHSTRFADSDRLVGVYAEHLVRSMVDGLATVAEARYVAQLNVPGVAVSGVKYSIELVDFDLSKFPFSVEKSMYEPLVNVNDFSPIPESDVAHGVWRNVDKYIKSRRADKTQKIPAASEQVVIVIARTIAKFVVHLCTMIKLRLESSGINTIQSKIIRSILDPYYRFAGVAQPEIPKQVKKKKNAAVKSA